VLLIQSILSPFYIFQIFSVTLWFVDEYEIYATCILVTSLVSMTFELVDLRKNLKKLRTMAYYECDVQVKRINAQGEAGFINLPSNDLVPGDIIIVPESTKMP